MIIYIPHKRLILIAAIVFTAASSSRAQVPLSTSRDFWRDPAFVNKFLGSYGVLSEVEPKITPDEQKLFKELIDLIQINPSAAASRLRSVITSSSSAALDFTLGNLNVQQGNYNEAVQNYKSALGKFPDFRRAQKNLGIVYVQLGEFKNAIDALTRALELGDEDGNSYGLIGYCYLASEKFISAESAYSKAMLFAPENLDWKLGLARAVLSQQKSKEAVALFEELIQKDPDNVDYWLFQANAFLELGETMKAADNYEIVRRMGKATAASLMVLGDIYVSHELKDLAVDAYIAALDKEPSQEFNRPLRALEILISRAAWPQAGQLLTKIDLLYRGKLSTDNQLKLLKQESKINLATGDSKAAVKTLEEIITRDPLDGEAILILANHYSTSEAPEKAEMLFERAAKLRDFEVAALTQHGQMLVAQAKYGKAAKLLQRAQSIRPRETVGRYLEQVERLARASLQ